jgi:hypothetical protein
MTGGFDKLNHRDSMTGSTTSCFGWPTTATLWLAHSSLIGSNNKRWQTRCRDINGYQGFLNSMLGLDFWALSLFGRRVIFKPSLRIYTR